MNYISSESIKEYIILSLLGSFSAIGFVVNSSQVVAQQKNFPDVEENYWAKPFIQALANKGIVTGYPDGKFRPKRLIERDEFAAIVRQAFDGEQVKKIPGGSYFRDVPQGYWAAPPIEEAYESGFMKAFPKNSFRPQTDFSKAEALVALTNGLNLSYQVPKARVNASTQAKKPKIKAKNRLLFPLASTAMMQPFFQIASASTPKASNTSLATSNTKNTVTGPNAQELLGIYYQDADKVPKNAVQNIAAATQANIVVNYPQANILQPNQNITRGEAAALVHQALVYRGNLSPINPQQKVSNYVVKYVEPLKLQANQ
ncbi:MAG: S-layer homology domain-containing protein [Rivularia sp. ALOHA_DT_140]|nr:S-layer homology domain-containing protein [Rivularia sp. ALOHA_DT_140]